MDTGPVEWRADGLVAGAIHGRLGGAFVCPPSLDACSAFSVGFIHDLVRRGKTFSVQSTDTIFILAGTWSAMSYELRHKTAVGVAICSQSSSKESAIKTAWAYRTDLLERVCRERWLLGDTEEPQTARADLEEDDGIHATVLRALGAASISVELLEKITRKGGNWCFRGNCAFH